MKRVWYSVTTGDYIWPENEVREFIRRFENLGHWEKANILYGMEDVLKELNTKAAKHYVRHARREDGQTDASTAGDTGFVERLERQAVDNDEAGVPGAHP
jgi:hypothetical protein